jgi:hypothetical protein
MWSRLRRLSVQVLGYVATGYGQRHSDQVSADVQKYKDWYGLDSIFFDEVCESHGRAMLLLKYHQLAAGHPQVPQASMGTPRSNVPFPSFEQACAEPKDLQHYRALRRCVPGHEKPCGNTVFMNPGMWRLSNNVLMFVHRTTLCPKMPHVFIDMTFECRL